MWAKVHRNLRTVLASRIFKNFPALNVKLVKISEDSLKGAERECLHKESQILSTQLVFQDSSLDWMHTINEAFTLSTTDD